MASNFDMLKSFVSHFQESLICTVCLDIPSSSPIYQCESGHLLCNNCWPKLTKCPSCRKQLTPNRSLLAEQMLEKIFVPCQNQGCKEKVCMGGGQINHDGDCLYAALKCLVPNCAEITCKASLIEHFLTHHYVQSVSENKFSGRLMLPEGTKFESHFWSLSDQLTFLSRSQQSVVFIIFGFTVLAIPRQQEGFFVTWK